MNEEYLVYLQTTQPVKWRGLFEALSPTLVDGNLNFTPNGLEIHGITHTFWVLAKLDNLERYSYNMKEPIPFGVNYEQLYKCYKHVKQNDIVSLGVTHASLHAATPHLITEVISDGVTHRGRVNLLDVESSWAAPDPISFDDIVHLKSSLLQHTLRVHSEHGDLSQFLSYKDGDTGFDMLFIRTPGDSSDIITCVDAESTTAKHGIYDKKGTSSNKLDVYRLRELMLATKATNLSSYVTIMLKENMPLFLQYNVGTLGSLTFMLAAHVDESNFSLDDLDISYYKRIQEEKKRRQAEEEENERKREIEEEEEEEKEEEKINRKEKNTKEEVKEKPSRERKRKRRLKRLEMPTPDPFVDTPVPKLKKRRRDDKVKLDKANQGIMKALKRIKKKCKIKKNI